MAILPSVMAVHATKTCGELGALPFKDVPRVGLERSGFGIGDFFQHVRELPEIVAASVSRTFKAGSSALVRATMRPTRGEQMAVAGGLLGMSGAAYGMDPASLGIVGAGLAIGVATLIGGGIWAASKGIFGKGSAASLSRDPEWQREKSAYEADLKTWKDGLGFDDTQLREFVLDVELKDQIVAISIKGNQTKALYDTVTRHRDDIMLGIEGLQKRVAEAEALVGATPEPTAEIYRRARAILNSDSTFSSGQAKGILFDVEERTVAISANMVPVLKAKITEAKQGWRKIKDAANARLHNVREDFSDADLVKMRARLKEAGIAAEDAAKVLAKHPLATDPETVWSELESLKNSDPVAYLDRLKAVVQADDALEVYVEIIAEAFGKANDVRQRIEQTDLWKKAGDDVRAKGDSLMSEILSLVQARADASSVAIKADEIVVFYNGVLHPLRGRDATSNLGVADLASVGNPSDVATNAGPSSTRHAGDDWWGGAGNGEANERWDVTPDAQSSQSGISQREALLKEREREILERKARDRVSGGGFWSTEGDSVIDQIIAGR